MLGLIPLDFSANHIKAHSLTQSKFSSVFPYQLNESPATPPSLNIPDAQQSYMRDVSFCEMCQLLEKTKADPSFKAFLMNDPYESDAIDGYLSQILESPLGSTALEFLTQRLPYGESCPKASKILKMLTPLLVSCKTGEDLLLIDKASELHSELLRSLSQPGAITPNIPGIIRTTGGITLDSEVILQYFFKELLNNKPQVQSQLHMYSPIQVQSQSQMHSAFNELASVLSDNNSEDKLLPLIDLVLLSSPLL